MSSMLIILLTIFKLSTLSCELVVEPKQQISNSIEDNVHPFTSLSKNMKLNDDFSVNRDESLNEPISSISIDYLNNALVLQFHRGYAGDDDIDAKRRSPLDKNFMRFGRANDRSRMRFGKRQIENEKDQNTISSSGGEFRTGRSDNGVSRDARGDNFMRFGRGNTNNGNLMRFGRSNGMMRFGRAVGQNALMRFGRASSNQNFMRFGRDQGFMRFGRLPSSSYSNLMRFDRDDKNNYENKDRSGFIRFGRAGLSYYPRLETRDGNLMRFGRNDNNFMRFGKLDKNFMRFGKRNDMDGSSSLVKQTSANSKLNEIKSNNNNNSNNSSENNKNNELEYLLKLRPQEQQLQDLTEDEIILNSDQLDDDNDEDVINFNDNVATNQIIR